MKCPNCNEPTTNVHPTFGVLSCDKCNESQNVLGKYIEFTTEQIKSDRKEFASDLIQPFREGELSKEYIEKYGTSKIKVSKEEIKKAKTVWKQDLEYYK